MNDEWQFFMGYRYAIFNAATEAPSGSVTAPWFEVPTP